MEGLTGCADVRVLRRISNTSPFLSLNCAFLLFLCRTARLHELESDIGEFVVLF